MVALTIHLHIQADTQQICALRWWLLLLFTGTSRPTPNKFALSEGGCFYHSLAHPGRHPTNLRSPKVVALTIHLHIQAQFPNKFALSEGGCSLPFTCTSRPIPNKFELSEGGCSYHSHAHPGRLPTNLRSPNVVALTIHLHIQAERPENLSSPKVVALTIHWHIQAETQEICALRR